MTFADYGTERLRVAWLEVPKSIEGRKLTDCVFIDRDIIDRNVFVPPIDSFKEIQVDLTVVRENVAYKR